MKNFKFRIDNRTYAVDIVNVHEKTATVNVNGVIYEVEVDKKLKTAKPVMPRRDFVPSTDVVPTAKADKTLSGKTIIRAPLPGKIVDVLVKVGDKVSVGQTVICIEAMKMEANVKAKEACTVAEVRFTEGQKVEKEDLLVVLA